MMVEKEQQQGYPLAPANAYGYGRSDQDGESQASRDFRREKRMKCFLYIFLFIVFQIGVITLFSLTIMKFKNPKFRVRSATFDTFDVVPATPTFNIQMNAELGVKNTNFGHFRYQNTTVDFYYRDRKVGEALVLRAKAKALSTREFNVTVNLSSDNVTSSSELGNDLSSGTLPLSSQSRLRGKVTIMKLMKKNRSANMNCTMDLVIATRELRNLACK